jgi:septal ring factor EnvC (AmiA/AmiB activator)
MEPEAEPLTYILNYYRDRIENNEEARRKWYDTLGKLRIPQDYDHKLRWEYKKRSDELTELETAVQDTHYALYDYRDKITSIKEDNDNLLVQEHENRKVIKDLLALNNSVEQHVHFSEGASPERLLSYAKTNLGK